MTDQYPGPYGPHGDDSTWGSASPYTSPGAHEAPGEAPTPDPAGDPGAYWRRPIDQPGTDPAVPADAVLDDSPSAASAPPAPAPPPAPAASSAPPAPPSTPPPSGASASDEGAGDGDADFDAWLAEYTREQPHVTILGERWPIPFDLPLWITTRVEQGDADLKTLKLMIDAVYGTWRDGVCVLSAADRWIDRGAGEFTFGTILAWTMLRTQGRKVSFAEAVTEAERMTAEAEAKMREQQQRNDSLGKAAAAGYAPDSHEARAEAAALAAVQDAGKAQWPATGAPSRPTSDVSTASTAPGWRG